MYKLNQITFTYNDQNNNAIDINHLELPGGKIYALLGANGSGKTTLLKILNGLLQFNTGTINYKDKIITAKKYKKLRQNSVYVQQNPLLLHGNVLQNIAYGLTLRKKSKTFINEVCSDLLELLNLTKLTKRKSKNLSGGEIKRVAIARALAIAPEVLLLDEPSAQIDKESLHKITEVLQKINQNLGTTIILSSHDQTFSSNIADEIIQLNDGRIL